MLNPCRKSRRVQEANVKPQSISAEGGELIVATNGDTVLLAAQSERATVRVRLTIAQACELYGALDVAIDSAEAVRLDLADLAAMSDAERAQALREMRREMDNDEQRGTK
jgi:hypothetical protein